MHRPEPRRIQHLIVGTCIVGAPLALGGAHPATNAILAALLLIATALSIASPSRTRPSLLMPGILLVALAATILQLIPLPVTWFALLSPGTYEVLSLAPGWENAWRPITLDLPATAHELVKLTICLCGALLAAQLYGRRHSLALTDLLRVIALAGGAVMLLGIVQSAAGFDHPYAAFGPVRHRQFVSSFINSNHLAGFLGFASIATLALALETGRGRRWLPLLGAVAMGTGVILSLSRGGIGAYIFSLALCAVVLARGRFTKGDRPALWVNGTLAGVLLVASYLAYTQIVHELWTLSDDRAFYKTEIWHPMVDLVAAFPLLGVGRGAFGMAYPRFSSLRAEVMFSHLENEWLQLFVDWGPLIGCIIVAGILYAFVRAVRRSAHRPSRLIAAFALVHLGLHNLMDFNLTLSSVALPAAMLLVVLGQPRNSSRRERKSKRPKARALAWAGLAILSLSAATASWYAIDFDINRDYERLRTTLANATAAQRRPQLEAIIQRHPTNFVLPLMVALREPNTSRAARSSLHWINRAMYLSPRNAGPHRLAGKALIRLGHERQGLMEYRLACEYQPALTRKVVEEVMQLTGDARDVAELGGDQPAVREFVAGFLLRQKEPELALQVLEPDAPPQTERGLTLAANAHASLKQFEQAHDRTQALEAIAGDRPAPYLVEARLRTAQGDPEGALAAINRGMEKSRNREQLLYQRANLLNKLGRHDEARTAARELLAVTGDTRMMARAQWLLGRLYERQGRRIDALRHYQQATDNHPKHAGYALGLMRLRMKLDDLAGARRTLEQARDSGARSKQLDAAFEALAVREAQAEKETRESFLKLGR